MTNKTIKCECDSCRGTGLYQGFAEGKGEAVICLACGGQGWTTFTYTEFEGRKKKRGVTSIRHSRGGFIATGVGGVGETMSYAEFEKKIPVKSTRPKYLD